MHSIIKIFPIFINCILNFFRIKYFNIKEEDYNDTHPIWGSTNLRDIPVLTRIMDNSISAYNIIHRNRMEQITIHHSDFRDMIEEMELSGQLNRNKQSVEYREKMNKIIVAWMKTLKKVGTIGREYNETIKHYQNKIKTSKKY